MTRIRAPSPTPSICSDAPVPETLQEDPPSAEDPKASWTIYAGNVSVRAFPPQGAECLSERKASSQSDGGRLV